MPTRPTTIALRRAGAVAAMLGLLAAAGAATSGAARAVPDRPNLIVIVTDDQAAWSIPHDPPAMPRLQARLDAPGDHWIRFTNAFVSSPMCCPSRATLLTGRYASRLGVRSNADGARLDDASTVASWLDLAGYETAYVGKYLNRYPFGREPFTPPGWDRWVAKIQGDAESVYHDYELVVDGRIERHGSRPEDYLTDVLAAHALEVVRRAPTDRPLLLWFAPTAPHPPWTPAARHAGAFADLPVAPPPEPAAGSPRWVTRLPPAGPATRAEWAAAVRAHQETLLSVDEAIDAILRAVEARGAADRTYVFVLTDNGYAFGEQGWLGKACPYDACTRTPLLVRAPGAASGIDDGLVSSVDLAPTLADLAGVGAPQADGVSLLGRDGEIRSPSGRAGLYLEWAGGNGVPAWRAVRTPEALYVEYADGERERYDLGPSASPTVNLASGRSDRGSVALADLLHRLAAF